VGKKEESTRMHIINRKEHVTRGEESERRISFNSVNLCFSKLEIQRKQQAGAEMYGALGFNSLKSIMLKGLVGPLCKFCIGRETHDGLFACAIFFNGS